MKNSTEEANAPNVPLALPQLQPQQQSQQLLQRKRLVGENLGLSGKWSKTPMLNEAGDCRRSFISSLKGLPSYTTEGGAPSSNPSDGDSSIGLAAATTGNLQRWSAIGSRLSTNNIANNYQSANVEEGGNETEVLTTDRDALSKMDKSPVLTSLQGHKSLHSFTDNLYDTGLKSFNIERKKSLNMIYDANNSGGAQIMSSSARLQGSSSSHVWPQDTKMNFIMLMGLMLALLLSKILQFLQIYFDWFKNQCERMRVNFLGNSTFWDLINLDDNTRYGLRMKLIMLPIIGICSALYGIVTLAHVGIKFLLGQVPDSLAMFVQKLYAEI